MKLKTTFISILFIISFGAIGQTYKQSRTEMYSDVFGGVNSTNHLLSNQSNDKTNKASNNSNLVTVAQIGNYNASKINVIAQRNDIDVVQNGDSNLSSLHINANDVTQSIIQNGSSHTFYNLSLNSNIQNLQIEQGGNGQNLTFFGGNSISENLRIRMQGENQTIIVRNFN